MVQFRLNEPEKVIKGLQSIATADKFKHVKFVVIDTVNNLMVSEEMRRCREKGYDKWMDLAQYIWKLVELPGTYREDLTVILVFHMKRSIVIDGQEVAFRASAAIPRIYRMRFHRDIFKDLMDLEKGIDKNNPENSSLDLFSLEMFENIAYVMAKHADTSIPDTPEWMDGFNTFSIYQVLPQIIELWGE